MIKFNRMYTHLMYHRTMVLSFLLLLTVYPSLLAAHLSSFSSSTDDKPSSSSRTNLIFILLDDVGWGDFAFNSGTPTMLSETPRINYLARQGMILTDTYSSNPLCSPSRSSIVTGRLPIRNGFYTSTWFGRNGYTGQGVAGGISDYEILLPELLHQQGYQTALYGKNHLGCPGNISYSPRGWSEWAGTCDVHFQFDGKTLPNLAFMGNGTMLGRLYESPEYFINISTHTSNLTRILTDYAVDFIHRKAQTNEPFFLFFVPDATHGPVIRSAEFANLSRRGPYGDSLMEIDYSIGRIMDALHNNSLDNGETFVFVSSDNGAATYDFSLAGPNGGFNGPLLCGKETTFEGGMREPTIAWWPGVVPSGSASSEIVTLMDYFTTAVKIAGGTIPTDRIIDGVDMLPVLQGGKSLNNNVFYYRGNGLFAVRVGQYKAHFWTWDNTPNATGPDNHPGDNAEFCPSQIIVNVTTSDMRNRTEFPVLFDLYKDPGERYPIPPSDPRYHEVIASIRAVVAEHEANLVPGTPQFDWCDDSTGNWSPPGCETLGLCLPIPPSNRTRCPWTH